MTRIRFAALVLRSWWELLRYDIAQRVFGFGGITRGLQAHTATPRTGATLETETTVCQTMLLASCFYWRPVLCLQRSVCTARVLRAYGIAARLVIGYRPTPFLSHAWVEVDGRVVNDLPAYRQHLRVLYTA